VCQVGLTVKFSSVAFAAGTVFDYNTVDQSTFTASVGAEVVSSARQCAVAHCGVCPVFD